MKHLFFYSLFTVLALLTSCQEYDLGYTPEQIGYNITFRKDFGDYDMANDFNLAQRGQVTVTPGLSTEVSVYGRLASGWQLVAKYDDVTETRTLGFDIPKGMKELMVSDNISAIRTHVGGEVSLSSTRAGAYDYSNGELVVSLNEGDRFSYYYFDKQTAMEFDEFLPEDVNNLGKVVQDFTMVSTGEFVLYPLYYNCGMAVKMGIYYYTPDNELVMQYIWGPHQYNQELQVLNADGTWQLPEGTIKPQCDDEQTGTCATHNTKAEFPGFRPNPVPPFIVTSPTDQFRSKGIVINLPAGTKFGFWQSCKHQYRDYQTEACGDQFKEVPFFSEAFRNRKYYFNDAKAPNGVNINIPKFATYFDKRGDLIIASEDFDTWNTNPLTWCDEDFNDRVFKIYGAVPEVLNNAAQSWLLPFEDLGGSFDWDFNDVILKMEYVSGQKTAKITPIAAGGTLHSEVFFNDTDDESKAQDLGEIHVLLGSEPVGEDELYEPINASHRGTPGTAKLVNITNPATFSIANAQSGANSSASGTSTKSMVGAYIVTKGNNGLSTIAYNGMGKAPAMLILPVLYDKDDLSYRWAWPIENMDIREAYCEPGHSFAEWVADHTKAQDWYMYPSNNVVEPSFFYTGIEKDISTPEYNISQFGTTISLPSKTGTEYIFNSNHFNGYSDGAVITVVLKGVQNNVLYAYDGTSKSSPLGSWSKLSYTGEWSVMGNNSCGSGSGSAKFEGMYQVSVSKEELELIKARGSWVITSNNDMCILYLAIKPTNSGVQPEEPGSSNDPANGSEPVLAPIR